MNEEITAKVVEASEARAADAALLAAVMAAEQPLLKPTHAAARDQAKTETLADRTTDEDSCPKERHSALPKAETLE